MPTRRRFILESAAAATLLAGCSNPAPVVDPPVPSAPPKPIARSGNWPLFRGDALASGVASSSLPGKLELLWTKEVEKGAFDATPAIVDGVIYIGDLDGTFYALSAKDGEEKWKVKRETYFSASPAVRDGRIFVGDIDGKFYCFNTTDGQEEWSYSTDAEINGGPNFWKENVLIGSQDANLYCFNANDGKLVWKFQIEDQIRCAPTIVGDRSFVAGCDSNFHILDLTNGKEVAAVPINAPTGVTPAVLGDIVYFGTEAGVIFAIDWKQGEVVWKYEDPDGTQPFRGSPAVIGPTESPGSRQKTIPAQVIVGSRSRRVRAFNPLTGDELWSFTTKQRVDSSPVIVDERVFVAAADGRLYALSRATGELLWQYEAQGGFTGSPAVADGKLVIASDRGTIYCFGAKETSGPQS